jgi:hypothetical protein
MISCTLSFRFGWKGMNELDRLGMECMGQSVRIMPCGVCVDGGTGTPSGRAQTDEINQSIHQSTNQPTNQPIYISNHLASVLFPLVRGQVAGDEAEGGAADAQGDGQATCLYAKRRDKTL